jgi:tight adherence protein B
MTTEVPGLVAAVTVVLTALAGRTALRRWRAHRLVARLGAAGAGQGAGAALLGPPDGDPRGSGRPTIAPVGRVLPPVTPPAWLARRVEDAFPGRDPRTLAAAWAVAAPAMVLVGGVLGGPGLALCALAGAFAGPAVALAWRRGAAARALEAALPDALEAVARALRSGAGSHQALAEAASATAGPLGAELARVVLDLGGGATLAGGLGDLERRHPVAGVRLAVAALLLGAEAGGAHARALDGVAATVRARLGVSAEVRALSSQTRLSAGVIAGAPLAFAGLALGTDASSAAFLLGTPLGLACLALGLALDGVGAWWMHRLAQVDA